MPVGNGHTKNVVISRWNKALIVQAAIDVKVNEAGVLWTKSNMCDDAQALVCYGGGSRLPVFVIYHGCGIGLRSLVEHLVCNKIEAVIPGLCVVGVWIWCRIKPPTDLERPWQSGGSGILVHT